MPATIPTPSWPAGCPSGAATTIWGRLVQPHGFGRWRDHDTRPGVLPANTATEEPIQRPHRRPGRLRRPRPGHPPAGHQRPGAGSPAPGERPSSTAPFPHAATSSPPPPHAPAATPPTRSGFPSAAPDPGDAWPTSPTPTAGHRTDHEPCPSSTASSVLGYRWTDEAPGRRGSAAAPHGVASRGSAARYWACGRRVAAHPYGGGEIAWQASGSRALKLRPGSR